MAIKNCAALGFFVWNLLDPGTRNLGRHKVRVGSTLVNAMPGTQCIDAEKKEKYDEFVSAGSQTWRESLLFYMTRWTGGDFRKTLERVGAAGSKFRRSNEYCTVR